jgi:hypothetical protein
MSAHKLRYATAIAPLASCLLAVIAAVAGPAEQARAQSKPAETLLLVDDHHVLYRSGTQRFLHPPKRASSKPLVPQLERWETQIGWTSIYRNPQTGKYQLWYQAYIGARAGDERYRCVVCYAESDDGLKFTKPQLDLFPYKEFPKTNIVLLGNGGYGHRYCNSVVVDEREPDPNRRYKMAYYDWSIQDGYEYPGMHLAFSPDGIHWTKHPEGPLYRTAYGGRGKQPVLAGEPTYTEMSAPTKPQLIRKEWQNPLSMSDAVDLMFDPKRNVFAIYGKAWIDSPTGGHAWRHAMARTESKDLLTWSKPQLLLTPDEHDPNDVEFHTSPVFFYNDCYFSLNQLFQRKLKAAIDIELMTSRDGLEWKRMFRNELFLTRTKHGLFDSRTILTNATPVILDDEIRFYYGACNQSPLGGVKCAPGERSGVGMVSIPRDRFAGIRPVAKSDQPTLLKPIENIGQVTLKAIDLASRTELTVNGDAEEGGAIRVELFDESGHRVRGCTRDDCRPLVGDSLRHAVAWNDKKLADLPPGRYQLRLHLDRAAVFAVTVR